jgi:vacuolar-type H+-ATPase subunit E/Vma4
MQPDTTIFLSYADNGEVTLRCGQSSVRLYPIEPAKEPPIHPLPILIEGDTIKLAIDAKEITQKAKLLTSTAAKVKKERADAAKTKAEQAKLAEYERCKAIVTPEAIRCCVNRVKRLRTLSNWIRRVGKELDNVPSLPQLIANPLFNAFSPEYSEAYGDARLSWIEATKKRDNFKPRSWRSKGLEKHNENVKLAFRRVHETALNALGGHIRATGFNVHHGSNPLTAWDDRSYNANDVRRCRKYIREYKSTPQT